MNIFKYSLIAVLAAGLTSCPGPTAKTVAVTGPASLANGAAAATYTATFTPSSTSGTVQWTMNPPSSVTTGVLSASTSAITAGVATVNYTPPVTVGAQLPVTITATLQGATPPVTGNAVVNVNPTVASGVTVNGTVLKWSGKPEGGVNITVVDAGGNISTTASAPDGKFTVPNVVTPYQLTAVPTLGTGIVPLSNDKVTITNPIVVVRKNAFAFAAPPGFQNECTPTPANGNLLVELSQPVGVGNSGQVVYIAPGINFRPTDSSKEVTLNAGASIFNLSVPFDKDMCYNDLLGTVVYIERNAGGTIVAKGVRASVPVFPSTTTKLNSDPDALPGGKLSVATSNSVQLTGSATFPSGVIQANVSGYLRVEYTIPVGKVAKIAPTLDLGKRTAYFPLVTKTITNSGSVTNWDLDIENFGAASGLTYRAGVIGIAGGKGTASWSDVIPTTGAGSIELNMPSIGGTQQPNGILILPLNSPFRAPAGNVIPDFIVAKVQNTGCSEGTNFLNNYVTGFTTASGLWLGSSDDEINKLPNTNEPARLAFFDPGAGFALNALCIRDANTTNASDKILDGRGIQRNFYTDAALTNPDFIRAGVFNLVNNTFEYRQ